MFVEVFHHLSPSWQPYPSQLTLILRFSWPHVGPLCLSHAVEETLEDEDETQPSSKTTMDSQLPVLCCGDYHVLAM